MKKSHVNKFSYTIISMLTIWKTWQTTLWSPTSMKANPLQPLPLSLEII